jgi:hypothetical protein
MYHRPFAHFRDFVSEIMPFTTLPVANCESSISSKKSSEYLQIRKSTNFENIMLRCRLHCYC